MYTASFKEFLENVIVEALHPELQSIVNAKHSPSKKQSLVAKKIRELKATGQDTGIEGNMPKGSSRAYMQHSEPTAVHIDNQPAKIKTGIKIAIKAPGDRFHDAHKYGGSLGELQNQVEHNDWHTNAHYRILTRDHDKPGLHYHTNEEHGIFPPLIDADHENNSWGHIGHARDVSKKEFQTITKNDTHKKGITHEYFVKALMRQHLQNTGRYWPSRGEEEDKIDHAASHPLTQKFMDYHANYGHAPSDYHIKNMGVFDHPDGSKHIVARDHGYNGDVHQAYTEAQRKARAYHWGNLL